MKKYFLHNGKETSGPFDLAELKTKEITTTTPVWYSGITDWKNAGDIDELRTTLLVPPPIKTIPQTDKKNNSAENSKILGLSKTTFYLILGIFVLIIATVIFNFFEENRSIELERENHKTEIENQKFLLQQKEAEEQKKQVTEQERLQSERVANDRKNTINNRLLEIEKISMEDNTNLEDLKTKLTEAKDFQLLRSDSERNEQINAIQTNIDSLEDEIVKLGTETNDLKSELERIQFTLREIKINN